MAVALTIWATTGSLGAAPLAKGAAAVRAWQQGSRPGQRLAVTRDPNEGDCGRGWERGGGESAVGVGVAGWRSVSEWGRTGGVSAPEQRQNAPQCTKNNSFGPI